MTPLAKPKVFAQKALDFRKTFYVDLDQVNYKPCLDLQRTLQEERIRGHIEDCFLLVEHPPTLTLGKSGEHKNILASSEWLQEKGFEIFEVERGGDVTYHGPGQLVGYPILDLNSYDRDIHALVDLLEEAIIRTLDFFGITAKRREGYPGVWVQEQKIASLGLGVKHWVTLHGFALNVNVDLSHFETITPCGLPGVKMTSMEELLGHKVSLQIVKDKILEHLSQLFDWEIANPAEPITYFTASHGISLQNFRPAWLTVTAPEPGVLEQMTELFAEGPLHTVCEGASCPNAGECFSLKTATFMILGNQCTRRCRFCSVSKGKPLPPQANEPKVLAQTVLQLGLKHVVITSVTRDDLQDGGARFFAQVVAELRRVSPETTVELLVPDFQGSSEALTEVVKTQPDILGHNLETVPRLYAKVRPGAIYEQSLQLLQAVKKQNSKILTKSGLMVGLGESPEEVLMVMDDLRKVGCDYLTLGQYLQPSTEHLPVVSFITPNQFERYREAALTRGFLRAECGPLVRSSYHARL